MGPSASGKTTLLRTIAGLEPVHAGEILLGNEVVSSGSKRTRPHARGVAMLFQEPSLWPHLTAQGNVELALPAGMRRAERRGAALGWLEKVGAGELAGRRPEALSGGERRLVELARALAARPRLLLLDEPTTHLDLHLRDGLMRTLRALQAELALPVLCVTHEPGAWLAPDDRVLVIEQGRLICDSDARNLCACAATEYTDALVRTLRRIWS